MKNPPTPDPKPGKPRPPADPKPKDEPSLVDTPEQGKLDPMDDALLHGGNNKST
jgi:hypothetical protein